MNITLPPTTIQEVINLVPEPYDWTRDPEAQPHKNYDPEKQYLTLILRSRFISPPDGYQGEWGGRTCFARPIIETWLMGEEDDEEGDTSDHRFNFAEFQQGWKTYIRFRSMLKEGVVVKPDSQTDNALYTALERIAVYLPE